MSQMHGLSENPCKGLPCAWHGKKSVSKRKKNNELTNTKLWGKGDMALSCSKRILDIFPLSGDTGRIRE